MERDQQPTGAAQGYEFRPKLAFYHANAKGTGGAITLELIPARAKSDGAIMLSAANQMTVGNRQGPNPTYPRFDWKNKLVVKLDFADLSRMLQVFRGECESLEDGRGLYHQTPDFTTRIVLQHLIDPVAGYSLELYRKLRSGEETRTHILLSPYEGLGLAESIAGSMAFVSFGVPMLVPQDQTTAADRREAEDGR